MILMQMTLSAGLLVAVVAALRTLALHRLPKATFLVLWGLAAARFLLPWSIPLPFSFPSATGRLLNQAMPGQLAQLATFSTTGAAPGTTAPASPAFPLWQLV